jgi:ferredoxin
MKRYRIEFDRPSCIGAYACLAIAPDTWGEGDDGKAVMLKEEFTLEELEKQLEAARACPVAVIRIYDLETGKEVPL